jgi:hypothetical protein
VAKVPHSIGNYITPSLDRPAFQVDHSETLVSNLERPMGFPLTIAHVLLRHTRHTSQMSQSSLMLTIHTTTHQHNSTSSDASSLCYFISIQIPRTNSLYRTLLLKSLIPS